MICCSDSVPHVSNFDYDQSVVFQVINNITSYLTAKFPNVAVYPMLGNHDVWPVNQVPDAPDEYYVDIVEKTGWSDLLTTSQVNSFKQGFCFTVKWSDNIL